MLCFRGAASSVCIVGLYLGLLYAPLSKATVIFWTCNIFIAIYGRIFLKEALTIFDWIAITFSFAGLVLIQGPFKPTETKSSNAYPNETFGLACSAVACIAGSIAAFMQRVVGPIPGVHYTVPTFYTAIITCLLVGLTAMFEAYLSPPDYTIAIREVFLVVFIALTFSAAQICMTIAFTHEKAGRVAPINNF